MNSVDAAMLLIRAGDNRGYSLLLDVLDNARNLGAKRPLPRILRFPAIGPSASHPAPSESRSRSARRD